MQTIDHSTYLALREGARVLEADRSGDKVLLLCDGHMLKLFRRKRLVTSAAFYPYAHRFADNALALKKRGIPCPDIVAVYRIASIKRDAVYYSPLAGNTVRQLQNSATNNPSLRAQLGEFVAQLHRCGVYFRSLHLGNVVLTPDNTLGLIDIADLKCQQQALSIRKRVRNFRHMLRYEIDRAWLMDHDAGDAFLSAYDKALEPSAQASPLTQQVRNLLSGRPV